MPDVRKQCMSNVHYTTCYMGSVCCLDMNIDFGKVVIFEAGTAQPRFFSYEFGR